MTDRYILLPGRDTPFGADLDASGCNFVVWAPDAERVELCLFDSKEQEVARLRFRERRGHLWYGYVQGVIPGTLYGYRVHGPNAPGQGLIFDPQKLLLDPYAKALSRKLEWNDELYQGDSQQMMPKAIAWEDEFDWQGVSSPGIQMPIRFSMRFMSKVLRSCIRRYRSNYEVLILGCVSLQ